MSTQTQTRTITAEVVTEALDKIVEKAGPEYDYVLRMAELGVGWKPETPCYNFLWRDGKRVPSCIVGQVLADLDLLDLVAVEHDAATPGDVSRDLEAAAGVVITDNALDLLWNAQVRQDKGDTWAEAVAYAKANGFTTEDQPGVVTQR